MTLNKKEDNIYNMQILSILLGMLSICIKTKILAKSMQIMCALFVLASCARVVSASDYAKSIQRGDKS